MSYLQPSTPPSTTEVRKSKIRRDSIESNSTDVGSSDSLMQAKAKTPSSHPDLHQHQRQLITPNTPFETYKKPLLSPSKSFRQSENQKQHTGQLETPRQTPRWGGSSRKRLGDAIEFKERPEPVNSAGTFLFPLASSTVGTGRNFPELRFRHGPESHLQLGDDLLRPHLADRETKTPHLRMEQSILTVKKVRKPAKGRSLSREEQLMNYTSDEESEDEKPEQGLRKVSKKLEFDEPDLVPGTESMPSVPSTPKNQLTSKEYAYKRYVEEKSGLSDNEELETGEIKPLINPFVGQFEHKNRQMPEEYSRFAHEVELVNQRTGKKVIRSLNEYERSIKPKILFAQENEEDLVEVGAQTPPNKTQIHIPGLGRSSTVEEDDPNEIIRHERIFNPFRGSRGSKRGRELASRDQDRFEEIEYINQTSGRRVKRKMSPEELAVKPRKLNFDDC